MDFSLLRDTPVQIRCELGRAQMTLDSLLQLTQGSVVELDKGAGESLDIYLNNKLIAHGKMAVEKQKFVVSITDVVSPDNGLG